ncbi:MAG: sn-glycerol-3-phosphate ABC transporter ATP-binding protein UgpC [Verrucomicrobiales bacterium]|jgi:multiple sugar transport system ATP-binding protein|nr:sn-glycerol-3-phosphate ABC transporter ATP-binding protein UgpC [Verrucomicrobiales bacterium]
MAKVIIEQLYKIYPGIKGQPGKVAVSDANFAIEDNEFMVLVGPSGCGKTTTLRMVAGLEEISRGAIYIDGKKINDVPPKDRDIAMVFQNYALYPHMTVADNMAFGLKLRGFPKAQIQQRVREAAQILGFLEPDNLLDRKPKALSGGQRQRVALGRAIVRNPKVFLFDEPLSNLDAKMRVEMRREITRLHQRLSNTMIYVTHDQVEAMTMADRIVVMKDGVVQQVAEPLTLFNEPANLFVAGFIGSPPINLIRGVVTQDAGRLRFTEKTAVSGVTASGFICDDAQAKKLQPYLGKEVIWGIRPEYIDVAGDDTSGGFMARIDLVELMGSESYVHCTVGGQAIVVRTGSAHLRHREGQAITVAPNQKYSLFFDPATELLIK